MLIVWDEAKRFANLAKHGLDFADFEESFDMETSKAFAAKPSRTGLNRFLLIGRWHDDAVVAVILSPLGSETVSLVSLRPASRKERKAL